MTRSSWRLVAQVALVGILAVLAFPSDGSAYADTAWVSLTATGPSPAMLKMAAGTYLGFFDKDSVAHTVVFANGLCSLTVAPGEAIGPGISVNGSPGPDCNTDFPLYAGSYAYTVDGRFPGTVNTLPGRRSVTLTARTHTIRSPRRLVLHGELSFSNLIYPLGAPGLAPFPVIVLARHDGSDPLTPIASVTARTRGDGRYRWRLTVRPTSSTTYVAEATGQLSAGTAWKPARSRPFTISVGR